MLNVEDGGVSAGKSLTQKELVQEIHKGGRKRSLSWAYETPFSVVHACLGHSFSWRLNLSIISLPP